MTVSDRDLEIARTVRKACVVTFLQAYEEAGVHGLCAEGRLEVAVEAVRGIDIAALCKEAAGDTEQTPKSR